MTIKTLLAQYESVVKHNEILYYQKRETKAVLVRVLAAILQKMFYIITNTFKLHLIKGNVESRKNIKNG